MHNCAFMHNCYSNCEYMHGYCSMCICYFINFRSHLFFSLFSLHNQWTQFSSPHLLFSQMHTNKHTHTHTQTNPHGQTNKETDRSSWVLIDAWSELVGPNWCLTRAHRSWSLLDWSFVLISTCGTIRARGSFAWTELVGPDQCLTRARGSWSMLVERSELVGLLLERSLTEMGLAWSELGRSDREGELICVGIEMGLAGDCCWRWVEIEQQIGKWGEKERRHASKW